MLKLPEKVHGALRHRWIGIDAASACVITSPETSPQQEDD